MRTTTTGRADAPAPPAGEESSLGSGTKKSKGFPILIQIPVVIAIPNHWPFLFRLFNSIQGIAVYNSCFSRIDSHFVESSTWQQARLDKRGSSGREILSFTSPKFNSTENHYTLPTLILLVLSRTSPSSTRHSAITRVRSPRATFGNSSYSTNLLYSCTQRPREHRTQTQHYQVSTIRCSNCSTMNGRQISCA